MPKQLLLVPQNAKDATLFKRLFELEGFNVTVTVYGRSIIPIPTEISYDLMFIDVIPGIGGELCLDLKKNPIYSKIPIILYRGWRHPLSQDENDYEEIKKYAHAEYMFTSPKVNLGELRKVIDSLLKPYTII